MIDAPRFNGAGCTIPSDHHRLATQHERVRDLMLDGRWRTLAEISDILNKLGHKAPESSVSAQLRHLRKPRFGGFVLDRRRRSGAPQGTFEYRVTEPPAEMDGTGQMRFI